MDSARRLYRLHLALALLAGGAVAAAAAMAFSRLQLGLPSGRALAAACRSVVPWQSSLAMLLTVALTAIGFVVFALAVRSAIRQLAEQRRILASLGCLDTRELCGHGVTVIGGRRPRAFCAGLLLPHIYLSAGAIGTLSSAELLAVIAHEAHHQARRDPLRIFLAGVLADALFFLPGLRRLGQRYRELSELAADEAATVRADRESLASALLHFGRRRGEAAAVVGIAPERVDHLLGEPPRWQLPLSVFAGVLMSVAALAGALVTLPALAQQGSLSLAALMAEGCMVAMIAAPLSVMAVAFSLSRRQLRRAGS